MAAPVLRGSETILLVEDDVALLGLVKQMLETLGYKVFASATPREAMVHAAEKSTEIKMLVTDMVMSGMTGWELAQKLQSLYPKLKCLYMSGHPDNVITRQGVLPESINFIQKPFSRKELAAKIREVLEDKQPRKN